MLKLEYDILLANYHVQQEKRRLGVEIYDAMLVEDGRVGGVVVASFEKARQHIEALRHEADHKKIEMARLAASGEGETVSKPGSPRPAGGQAFFSASKKHPGAVKAAIVANK